jgi:peroxiredoxin-like protein
METFTINTKWERTSSDFSYDNFNRNHLSTFSGAQTLNTSSAPNYKGNADMANPEELLASALSSCHMLTFLAVASKSGFVIDSYEDDAVAVLDKNESGMLCITNITLHPTVKFSGEKIPDQDKLKGLHDKAHRNCFIANSIKSVVEVVF